MSERINLDDPDYSQGQVTIQNDKAKIVWIIIGILTAIIIVITIILQSGSGSGSSSSNLSDPNRTVEECVLYGETKVFPAAHSSGRCISDGDGYFLVGFGHHHHK